MRKKLRERFEKLAGERPVWLAFMVFIVTSAVVVPLSIPFWLRQPDGFSINVMSEAYGTLFDLLIIGWLLLWLNKMADRRQQKMRYREEIEDALGWRSPVAAHRIVSNVRRLNRSGVIEGVNLPEAYLEGASLENVQLKESNVWGAYLKQATLRQAELSGAVLAGAHFEEADLENARLKGADLRGANLRGADMERVLFEEADLRGANLENADLQYSSLSRIILERAIMNGINLRGATLMDADMSRATLCNVNLIGANMENARLDGADLTGARLRKANLRGCSFDGTILRGADLTEVDMGDGEVTALGAAQTLHQAVLDDAVRERLREAHSHLFEAPQEETSQEDASQEDASQQEDAPQEKDEAEAVPAVRAARGEEAEEPPAGDTGTGPSPPVPVGEPQVDAPDEADSGATGPDGAPQQ